MILWGNLRIRSGLLTMLGSLPAAHLAASPEIPVLAAEIATSLQLKLSCKPITTFTP